MIVVSTLFAVIYLSYFFVYMMGVFPFQNNYKDLDPSYKMDLDLWDCFEKEKNLFYS